MTDTAQETQAPHKPRRPWWFYVAFVGALLAGVLVAFVFLRPYVYNGTVIQSPYKAPDLDNMFFHTGEPAELWHFDDEVVVVYFGYTHCPDICPTTLSAVARAKDQLSAQNAERVQMLMVSVDPERDDPESLGEYMEYFDPNGLGVYGDETASTQAATLYGIYVHRNEGTAETGYTIDHTANLIGIDTDGYVRIVWPTDVTPDALAADLEHLLG
jgi:protein SCO1/2